MKGFLAISAAGGRPGARLPAGVAALLGEAAASHRTPDGWVVLTPAGPGDEVADPGTAFTVRLTRSIRDRTTDLETGALARLLAGGTPSDPAALAAILPPWGAAHRAGPDAPVVMATDWLGMRHLYHWQGDGIAAISTSARCLARLAGAGLDTAALGVQSLLGWQLGTTTAFADVRKLGPGCLAVLAGGRVSVRRYADESLARPATAPEFGDVVDEMATILRDFHRGYLADHPGTVLQLTGGQDSRLLLCAVPPEQRASLRALTLDVRGGVESRIAGRLSALAGLPHQVYRVDQQPPVSDAVVHDAALAAAAALECGASPVALAPLALIEAQLEQGHRLSGAGGETARGFYYAGQPAHAGTSARLVERLAGWRLFVNEAVAADALDPGFAAARREALAAVEACFRGYDDDWLRATDEFYLWQRTQRWAGAHGTAAATDRFFVNPLLDRRFMELALVPAPEDKRGSRLTGRLMVRLDPALAAVPLDSGLVPGRLGGGGWRTRAALARVAAGKAAAKLRQRATGGRRTQLGAAAVAEAVVRHWRAEPGRAAALRDTGIIRADWLGELLAGRRPADPATVAFLLNVLVATEAASGHPVPAGAGAAPVRG
ncbi:hypothetical protein [Pseudosporangium ferrugineum]|uniref:Asparagine synthase (Glutamine-hydrolysing) n=1 Tax=Pseudosporangium ferrugineum TaxID=439699 RepID=A0A2T0SF49_9ACTN|nr:hypothetical protein [Pseudosporangium ferrugineum]PRY32042.1 asparagine synthase (glutamine-hydrolysing) [Pseudosporangium ferrugineum]